MENFETCYAALKQAGVIGYQQVHFEECKTIWQNFIPQIGQAECVQGELLREVEKLRYEACVNGNKNWNGQFVWACGNVYNLLAESGLFDEERLSLLRTALAYLKACGEYARAFNADEISEKDVDMNRIAHTGEDVYDFIEDYIAEFYIANRTPIPYEKHDFSKDE